MSYESTYLYIYTIYAERSFSKASKKLLISQPALSAVVKKVEKQIGFSIFNRNTIPLTVTPEGEYYIKKIKEIISIEKNLQQFFSDKNSLTSGKLVLGGSSYFCSFVFPELINHFLKKFPKIQIELIEGNTEALFQSLEEEKIDIILETQISPHENTTQKFLQDTEHIVLAVPSSWEINKQLKKYIIPQKDICNQSYLSTKVEAVPLKSFENLPFVRLKKGNDQWYRGSKICQNAGFTANSVFMLDQAMTAFNIIATSDYGALFLRDSIIKKLKYNVDSVVFYKIGDSLAKRNIFVVIKKEHYLTRAMKEFIYIACPNITL